MAMNAPPATRPTSRLMMTGVSELRLGLV